MNQRPKILKLHPDDNVAVALTDLTRHLPVAENLVVATDVPRGHKIALRDIPCGDDVTKFGFPIGQSTREIGAGQLIHEHNLNTGLGQADATRVTSPESTPAGESTPQRGQTVPLYIRDNGRVAARNEIWIINTVACVNQIASRLAEQARLELLPRYANIDGIHAFPHPYGCSQLGDDLSATRQILASLINHPHAAAVLVLGLGCENNQILQQMACVDETKQSRVRYFNTQDVSDELEQGYAALVNLIELASADQRTPAPASGLVLGMKCGGSDGLSGITANPLLGRIADRHTAAGGTVLLTEVPEMFGAESPLLDRCANEQVRQSVESLIAEFKQYFQDHNQPISENPSPGNRASGITTLEEKSLGCVQKAGSTGQICEVVPYGQCCSPQLGGIALVNGPGNDGVSTTALTAAGANLILFSTGLGTPLGAPVPTLKIATNTTLADNKPSWIDFDAGRLLSADQSMDELADELYEQLLAVAAGEQLARNEQNGYREIAIWKTGVTL